MSEFLFTAEGSPEAESRVHGDLERIRSVLLQNLPADSVQVAALAGGFGRGEGGVIRPSGGPVRAFNDYDIVVFTRDAPDTARLLAAAPTLAAELDVDFIDFGVLDQAALDRAAPTVFWYEFLEGHKVLCGPRDFLDRIPRIDPAALPAMEATRLMINRGMGLLWAWLHLEDAEADPASFDDRRRRFTVNAVHKAILAMGEAALILASDYHVSYRERARRVAGSDLALPPALSGDFREAHRMATQFKLYPEIPSSDIFELREWWYATRVWHEQFFRWIEEHRQGRPIGPWKNYLRRAGREALARAARHPRRFAGDRRIGSALKGLSRFVLDAELSFRAQLPFLLYGIGPEGHDVDLLASGLRGFGAGPSRDARHWRSLAGDLIGQWHP